MWRNYVTVGVRALAKNKAYAFINIFGLAIGLAACLLILLYVRYEQSYDDWLPNADQVFQLQTYYSPNGRSGEAKAPAASAIVAGRALTEGLSAGREGRLGAVLLTDRDPGRQAREVETLRMMDSNLFEVFKLPFVRGNAQTALPDSHSVALSESEARRVSANADPIGKTLTIVDNTGDVDYRVTGVFKDIPRNSNFSADMVARFDLGAQFADRASQMTRLGQPTGLELRQASRRAPMRPPLNAQMPAWEKRNIPDGSDQRRAPQCGRRNGPATGQHPRRASRQGAGFGMTPGQRSPDGRNLRSDRAARARHGRDQLHQPRNRAGLATSTRSRAAKGAGR